MESSLEIVEKQKKSIKLKMLHYDNTLLKPLIEEILKDDMVEEARYYIRHPVIDDPEIIIKVKGGSPQAALNRSIKRLSKNFEDLLADFNRELKQIT